MRISGITIPDNKRIEIGLTAVFGIGRSKAHEILDQAGIDYGTKPKEISQDQEMKVRQIIENIKIEGDLRREVSGNIKRMKDIGSYRGTRHARSLPARGQNTRTNSRTLRGNVRKTMGSGKRKVEKK